MNVQLFYACQTFPFPELIVHLVKVAGSFLVYNSMIEAPKEEKLSLSGKHVFKSGSAGEFTCTGSTFLYAGGFRWGIKAKGRPVKVLEPSKSSHYIFP